MNDYERERREQRRAEAFALFEQWQEYLELRNWGHGVPAAERVRAATWAIQDYRQVMNQRGADNELACLAVRVTADTLANQIAIAAGPQQDGATIAWVVAGLRCPSQPFCIGCPACLTVTSPGRPA